MNLELDSITYNMKKINSQEKYIEEYGGNLLFLNELINIIKNISNPKVLDIGCGSGTLAQFISLFSDVTGTEISRERYFEANKKIKCLHEKEGTIPQNIGLFDLIYCKEVLPSIKDKANFYKQIHETLAKNGFFCTYLPDLNDISEKPLFNFLPFSKSTTVSSYSSITENKILLKDAGFSNIKETRISLGSVSLNENYANKHKDGYFNNSGDEFENFRVSGINSMVSSINCMNQEGYTIFYEFERTMIIAQK
jgi:SAM-dependent methyltransferase